MCNHYANHPEIQKELSTWRKFIGWSLKAPLPPDADLAWLMKRMPRMITSGELVLASNLNTDRLAHLIAAQAR